MEPDGWFRREGDADVYYHRSSSNSQLKTSHVEILVGFLPSER